MDASHILVGGLTAITIAWLVWIELRSRRNSPIPQAETPPQLDSVVETAKPVVQPGIGVCKKGRRRQ
jgi:hypothetical protein